MSVPVQELLAMTVLEGVPRMHHTVLAKRLRWNPERAYQALYRAKVRGWVALDIFKRWGITWRGIERLSGFRDGRLSAILEAQT